MEKSAAHQSTPQTAGGRNSHASDKKAASDIRLFFVMALDLSWRMAAVVLVPILGGYYLDRTLGTSPVLMIVGFIIAMAGTFVVMKRAWSIQNRLPDGDAEQKT